TAVGTKATKDREDHKVLVVFVIFVSFVPPPSAVSLTLFFLLEIGGDREVGRADRLRNLQIRVMRGHHRRALRRRVLLDHLAREHAADAAAPAALRLL